MYYWLRVFSEDFKFYLGCSNGFKYSDVQLFVDALLTHKLHWWSPGSTEQSKSY